MLCDSLQEVIYLPMSTCEIVIWRFGEGVSISCTLFVSFSSGYSEIAAKLFTSVQPFYSSFSRLTTLSS